MNDTSYLEFTEISCIEVVIDEQEKISSFNHPILPMTHIHSIEF